MRNIVFIPLIVGSLVGIVYLIFVPSKFKNTAEYKQAVWEEVSEYKYRHIMLPLKDIADTSSTYEERLTRAIFERFGEEKTMIYLTMYDSMTTIENTQAAKSEAAANLERKARDSLWQKFKKDNNLTSDF